MPPSRKNSIRRTYHKYSPNFPPELERLLHSVIKEATLDAIIRFEEKAMSSLAGVPIALNRAYARKELKNPTGEINWPVITMLGDYIYAQMMQQCDRKCFQTNDVSVDSCEGTWKFTMRSLSSQMIRGGQKVYYSLITDKININGAYYRVAYTQHCIDRIHQRSQNLRYTYIAMGELFRLLYSNNYFEQVVMPDGSTSLSIFGLCMDERFTPFKIVKAIYGENYYPEERYYYRIGYLPVELSGEFAVAKTLLCPGYYSTPEFELLQKSEYNLDWLKRAQENERKDNLDEFDLELIRIFHQLGVEQVRIMNNEVFRFGKL